MPESRGAPGSGFLPKTDLLRELEGEWREIDQDGHLSSKAAMRLAISAVEIEDGSIRQWSSGRSTLQTPGRASIEPLVPLWAEPHSQVVRLPESSPGRSGTSGRDSQLCLVLELVEQAAPGGVRLGLDLTESVAEFRSGRRRETRRFAAP